MKKLDTKKLVLIIILFVITLLLTWLVHFDYPFVENKAGGYWTLGDVGVFIAAALLGGPWGAAVAAVASALADIFVGQIAYAPASLFIKAGMALLFSYYVKHGRTVLHIAKGTAYAGLMMAIGYFLYDIIFRGSYAIASFAFILNLLQAVAAGIIATPVLFLLGGKNYRQGQGFTKKQDNFQAYWSESGTRNLK